MSLSPLRIPLLLCVLLPGLALAQRRCPEPAGANASVGDVDPDQRLAFIQSHLRDEAHRARTWMGGWGGGYAVLALGQLAVAPVLSPGDQVDFYVGVISSAGGVAELLALPLDVIADAPALDALVAQHPGPVDCAVLAEAERLLARSAQSEADGRGWLMQGANLLYNVATGLVLGQFFDRWTSAAVTAASGWAIGEAMLLTQPSGAEDALRLYREANLQPRRASAPIDWRVGVALAPDRFGLQLRLAF